MLADCGNVSSERFALAHRRSLTYINRKTYQYNAMHIWGASRRVVVTWVHPISPPFPFPPFSPPDTQIYPYTDLLTPIFTHIHTRSYKIIFILRPAHTQSCPCSDFLMLSLTRAPFAAVLWGWLK
eukprot:8279688-Pyramimonas_sp.AAC.1